MPAPSNPLTIYTIGHSNIKIEVFINLLRHYGINCVVDVRSQAFSRYFPAYNEDRLKAALQEAGMYYLNFNRDFGPRHYDCLDADGLVVFERVMAGEGFLASASRILRGLEHGYGIVLMGTMAEPMICHRFSLLGRYFSQRGLQVLHILKEGQTVPHRVLEQQMVKDYLTRHKLPHVAELFDHYTPQDQVADAYRLKNREIGFRC